MAQIRFLYLDVGGVALLDLTYGNRWESMLNKLGVTEQNRAAFDTVWIRHYHEVCTTYDANQMIPELRSEVGLFLPDDFSVSGFLVGLFEINPLLPKILEAARETNLKIGLLTNMYVGMLDQIFAAGKLSRTDYDLIIDSTREKVQKPDPNIYVLAETKAQTKPEEILFIDNAPDNLKPAAARGWQTLLYQPENLEASTLRVIDYLKNGKYTSGKPAGNAATSA